MPPCKECRCYGERDIRVCPEWQSRGGFATSLKSVGLPPFARASLDRIDNEGHYERGNVRWADQRTEMWNARSNRVLTFQGRTMTLVEWAEFLGIKAVNLGQRLLCGWPTERARTRPVEKRKPVSEWKPRKSPR